MALWAHPVLSSVWLQHFRILEPSRLREVLTELPTLLSQKFFRVQGHFRGTEIYELPRRWAWE